MDAHLAAPPGAVPQLSSVRLRMAGDERLAKLAGEGNEAAFAALFQRFHQPLYRYCRSLLGNDADAQDALQTTFTQALVALREDRRTAPVRPWLYRIAHNEAISLLRRRRPTQELPEDGLLSPERSPDEVMEERSRLTALVADLHDLPDRQRGALVMRELSGLPHEEIAAAFGISVGAAKQTVLEARRSLQEFAEGRSMACEEIQRIVSDGDGRALRGRRVRAHLRDCSSCRAFATAIPARRAELRALSPALPVAASAGLLARLTGAGSGHGGGSAGMAASAGTKAAAVATSTKVAATGAAVVVAAALGAGEIHHLATRPAAPAHAAAPTHASGPAPSSPFRAPAHFTHLTTAPSAVRGASSKSPSSKSKAAGASGTRQHGRRHGAAAAGTAAGAGRSATASHHRGNSSPQTTGQGAAHRADAASAAHGPSSALRGRSAMAPGHTVRPAHASPSRAATGPVRRSTTVSHRSSTSSPTSSTASHSSSRSRSTTTPHRSSHAGSSAATHASTGSAAGANTSAAAAAPGQSAAH